MYGKRRNRSFCGMKSRYTARIQPVHFLLVLLRVVGIIFMIQQQQREGYVSSFHYTSYPTLSLLIWGVGQQHQQQQQPRQRQQSSNRMLDDSNHNDNNSSSNDNINEAQRLLEKVKQMRMEIATMTGQSIEDVEQEAAEKKSKLLLQEEIQKAQRNQRQPSPPRTYIVPVPETVQEQVQQAADAIERAYKDGNVRKQIVRFAFVPVKTGNDRNSNTETNMDEVMTAFVRNDQDWPGGIQQIYREAAQPYVSKLVQQVRIGNHNHNRNDVSQSWTTNKPIVQEQTLWDFDGSAIITATTSISDTIQNTTIALVQALIHPNTDNRYFDDILQLDTQLRMDETSDENVRTNSRNVVNLIVNPFWTNATSWGFNLFAPNAQNRANDIIFQPKLQDGNDNDDSTDGYMETYSIITKTVRGEDCIAIRAYPYEWQLYAYIENNDRIWSRRPFNTIYLGSSVTEPSVADFVPLLNNHTEFQYSKNMRQMKRTFNNNNNE
jgi:Domain of unknown function (DUF1995)